MSLLFSVPTSVAPAQQPHTAQAPAVLYITAAAATVVVVGERHTAVLPQVRRCTAPLPPVQLLLLAVIAAVLHRHSCRVHVHAPLWWNVRHACHRAVQTGDVTRQVGAALQCSQSTPIKYQLISLTHQWF